MARTTSMSSSDVTWVPGRSYSEERLGKIDAEVKLLVDTAYNKAKAMLSSPIAPPWTQSPKLSWSSRPSMATTSATSWTTAKCALPPAARAPRPAFRPCRGRIRWLWRRRNAGRTRPRGCLSPYRVPSKFISVTGMAHNGVNGCATFRMNRRHIRATALLASDRLRKLRGGVRHRPSPAAVLSAPRSK